MSFLDAIIEKQKQDFAVGAGKAEKMEILLQRVSLKIDETAGLRIRKIDNATETIEADIEKSDKPSMIGKTIVISNATPFLNEADQFMLSKFKKGGLITIKYTKRKNKNHIFIFSYED